MFQDIIIKKDILTASKVHLSGCFFSSSVRMESRVLSSMDFVFNMTREAIQACFSSELSAFSMTWKQATLSKKSPLKYLYFLLIPGTELEGVLDALLVLPVPDVDEPDGVLVPVPQLPQTGGGGHAGAGSPGGRLTADYQQAVTEDHVALLQLLLVRPHLSGM